LAIIIAITVVIATMLKKEPEFINQNLRTARRNIQNKKEFT
jgi:hypothetical protein